MIPLGFFLRHIITIRPKGESHPEIAMHWME